MILRINKKVPESIVNLLKYVSSAGILGGPNYRRFRGRALLQIHLQDRQGWRERILRLLNEIELCETRSAFEPFCLVH